MVSRKSSAAFARKTAATGDPGVFATAGTAAPPHHPDDTRIELDVSLQRSSQFFSGFTERLSLGDCFIATHRVEPVGNRLEVTLHQPAPHPPIHVLAEVRWQRSPAADRNLPPGLGLRFIDPDPATTAAIAACIARNRPAMRPR